VVDFAHVVQAFDAAGAYVGQWGARAAAMRAFSFHLG
jgi:hypothetical protein